MIDFTGKSVILWDFDGVILNSMPIREYGFKTVLKNYPKKEVEKLLKFHRENGGLSRYVKFRYFFEEILEEDLSDERLGRFTTQYSEIMREKLCQREFLITETVNFIDENQSKYKMHIVSGSDEKELQYLCEQLQISHFFESITGSPTPKVELVSSLIEKYDYNTIELCLIGDSRNDFEAAQFNGIDFYGYNNNSISQLGKQYIKSFF